MNIVDTNIADDDLEHAALGMIGSNRRTWLARAIEDERLAIARIADPIERRCREIGLDLKSDRLLKGYGGDQP